MLDIKEMIFALARAIESADFMDATLLASNLGVDLADAEITQPNALLLAVTGAKCGADTTNIDILARSGRRNEITIAFPNENETLDMSMIKSLGVEPAIQKSHTGSGLAYIFRLNEGTITITASLKDGIIQTLSAMLD
jgi:hypothetical protein